MWFSNPRQQQQQQSVLQEKTHSPHASDNNISMATVSGDDDDEAEGYNNIKALNCINISSALTVSGRAPRPTAGLAAAGMT